MTSRNVLMSAGGGNTLRVGDSYGGRYIVYTGKAVFGNGLWVTTTGSTGIAVSNDGIRFRVVYTVTGTNILNAVSWNGTTFVAVGTGGLIFTSTNGLNWTQRTSGVTDTFNGVAWGAGVVVAVGSSGRIRYSGDGTSWFAVTSPTTNGLQQVIFAGGRFVAVGASGTIITSTDGTTWNVQTSGSTSFLVNVAYNGTTYFATGTGANGYLTSPNATTWTVTTPTGVTGPLSSLYWTGSAWLGGNSSGQIFISNGSSIATWTLRYASGIGATYSGLVSNGSRLCAIGWPSAYSDDNGATWTASFTGPWFNIWDVTVGNNLYVLTAFQRIWTSPNGIDWALRTNAPAGEVIAVGFGNGRFVATQQSNATCYTSTDGITWTAQNLGAAATIRAIAYGAGLFVAVGSIGTPVIRTSPDGVTWTARSAPAGYTGDYQDVFRGSDGQFIAVGTAGAIHTSPDGITWTARTSGVTTTIQRVAHNGSLWVATGNSGYLRTSPDGITWTARTSAYGTENLMAVAWVNNRWLVSGNLRMQSSTNGTTWVDTLTQQYQVFTINVQARRIALRGNQFVTVLGTQTLALSPAPLVTNT